MAFILFYIWFYSVIARTSLLFEARLLVLLFLYGNPVAARASLLLLLLLPLLLYHVMVLIIVR